MSTDVEHRQSGDVRISNDLAVQIRSIKPYLEKLLPGRADSFAMTLMAAGRYQPELYNCTPESVIGAALTCAQLDLEPGPAEHIYFIPRRSSKTGSLECTTYLSYKGEKALVERHPDIDYIETGTVHKLDEFEHTAQPATIRHTPAWGDRGDPYLWYAVAHRADGRQHVKVLDRQAVEARRACSQSPNRGPWKDHFDAMARKSCIRALWPELPSSLDLTRAARLDEPTVVTPRDLGVPDEATVEVIRDQPRAIEREHVRLVDDDGEVIAEADVPAGAAESPPEASAPPGDASVPDQPPGEDVDGTRATSKQLRAIVSLQKQRQLDDHDLLQVIADRFDIAGDELEPALVSLTGDQAGELIDQLQPSDATQETL